MSDAEAGVGAHLDLGTYSLDAIAGLKASADSLAAQFKAWIDEEQAYQYGALDISLGGNGTTDSVPTDLAISLGGPPVGKMWEIRQLYLGGLSPATTAVGTVAVLVASSSVQVTTGGVAPSYSMSTVDFFTSPSARFYSARQVPLHFPEQLFLVVHAGTDSTVYVANGTALETPDRRVKGAVQL